MSEVDGGGVGVGPQETKPATDVAAAPTAGTAPAGSPETVPGETVWFAARMGDFKKFYEELRLNPVLLSARDSDGHSFLHWFALNNHEEAVRKLLSLGAEIDARADNLQTPFMWAVLRGNVGVAQLLLDHGADKEARDSLGATPLILAVQHEQHLSFLWLVDRGADPELGDVRGATCVHWAAYKGDFTVMRMLIRRGIDVHKYDAEGMNAFHRACRGGQGEMAHYLYAEHDFDVDAPSKDVPGKRGKRAFAMATELGHQHIVEMIRDVSMSQQQEANQMELCRSWSRWKRKNLTFQSINRWGPSSVWIFAFFMSLVVYYTDLMTVTAHYTSLTLLFFGSVGALGFVFFSLYRGDPGFLDPFNIIGKINGPGVLKVFQDRYRRAKDATTVDVHDEGTPTSPRQSTEAPPSHVARIVEETAALPPPVKNDAVCFSCELVKPMRSKHCAVCDRCVSRMDHHCTWIGTCVGAHNHRMFMMWAVTQFFSSLLFLFFAGVSLNSLYWRSPSIFQFFGSAVWNHTALSWAAVMNGLALAFAVAILRYHTRQIFANMTTNEQMNLNRYQHFWVTTMNGGVPSKQFQNPFSQATPLENCKEFWGLRPRKNVSRTMLQQRDAELKAQIQEQYFKWQASNAAAGAAVDPTEGIQDGLPQLSETQTQAIMHMAMGRLGTGGRCAKGCAHNH